MEGISGLSLISSHQRNVLNQMMKASEGAGPLFNQATALTLQHMIPNGVGFGSGASDMSTFGIPYRFPPRTPQNSLPSPISPTSRQDNVFESDRKGEQNSFKASNVNFFFIFTKNI